MRTTWLWLVVLLHWSCGQCDGASFGRPEGVRQPLKDASAPGGDTTTKRGAGGVPDPIHAAANCASLRDSAHECCVMYLSNAALMFKHIDDPWFLHKHALGAQRERWAALGCTRYAAVLMAARESEDSTVQRPAGRQRRADTEVASALTARGAGGDGRLFIGVLSPAVGAKAQRDRNLYRDRCVPHYSAFEAPYKFFVALPDTNPLPKKHWQGMLASDADAKAGTSLMQEAADFGDIEVLSFAETYANLPLKTLGIMKFAAEHGYSYMMKIDVEYCVHVPAVLAAIREHERLHPGTELYLGDKAWHGTEYDSMKQKDGVRVPFGRGLTWGLSLGLAQLIAQADWIHSVLYLSYGSSSEDVDLARWVLYAVETHGVAVERLYHENAFFRTIAVDMDPKFARCLGMYKANPSAKIGKTWGSMTKDDQATWHQLQCDHLAEHLDDRRDVFLAQRNMQRTRATGLAEQASPAVAPCRAWPFTYDTNAECCRAHNSNAGINADSHDQESWSRLCCNRLSSILDHSAFRAHSAARSTDRETIVCLGGSATAGGGGIPLHSQYPYLIAKRHTQWHVYNRAHGASDTLWASLMFDSLVPVDASVIVWEFAINDVGFVKGPGGQQLELDVFRRFMHQVRAHPSNPLVVFVFQGTLRSASPPSKQHSTRFAQSCLPMPWW